MMLSYCNLSPRGDGNTISGAPCIMAILQFIPTRGRKPEKLVPDFYNCNLSSQGDKKAPLPLAFASSGGALLFLIFYFTGWELRLPESSL
jgi:hypothetical protein